MLAVHAVYVICMRVCIRVCASEIALLVLIDHLCEHCMHVVWCMAVGTVPCCVPFSTTRVLRSDPLQREQRT